VVIEEFSRHSAIDRPDEAAAATFDWLKPKRRYDFRIFLVSHLVKGDWLGTTLQQLFNGCYWLFAGVNKRQPFCPLCARKQPSKEGYKIVDHDLNEVMPIRRCV